MTDQQAGATDGRTLASAESEAAAEAAAEAVGNGADEAAAEAVDGAVGNGAEGAVGNGADEAAGEMVDEVVGSGADEPVGEAPHGGHQDEALATSMPDTVRAEHVELKQGGANRIEATSVTITQGGASRIDARDVTVTMGGAALVKTESLHLGSQASAMAVITRRAQLAPGSRVVVLVARQASGDVRPVLDWRGALAIVAGFILLRRILGRRRGR